MWWESGQDFQEFAAVTLALDLEHDCIYKDPVQCAQQSVVPLWISIGTAQIEEFHRLDGI